MEFFRLPLQIGLGIALANLFARVLHLIGI